MGGFGCPGHSRRENRSASGSPPATGKHLQKKGTRATTTSQAVPHLLISAQRPAHAFLVSRKTHRRCPHSASSLLTMPWKSTSPGIDRPTAEYRPGATPLRRARGLSLWFAGHPLPASLPASHRPVPIGMPTRSIQATGCPCHKASWSGCNPFRRHNLLPKKQIT